MTGFLLIFLLSSVFHLPKIEAKISDKRLCADKQCSEPISTARTLLRYSAPEKGMVSFDPNEVLTIYSKSAGSNANLWGVERNGMRGYVPKNYLREEKVFKKNLKFIVDTEFVVQEVPSDSINVKPDKAEPIVVDGTTIYGDDIAPSVVTEVIPTAVPFQKTSYEVEEEEEEDDMYIEGEDDEEDEEDDEDEDEKPQQQKPPTYEEGEIPKSVDSPNEQAESTQENFADVTTKEQIVNKNEGIEKDGGGKESINPTASVDPVVKESPVTNEAEKLAKESSSAQLSEITSDVSSEQNIVNNGEIKDGHVDNKEEADSEIKNEQPDPSLTQKTDSDELINTKDSTDGLVIDQQADSSQNKVESADEQESLTQSDDNPTEETKQLNENSDDYFIPGGFGGFFSFQNPLADTKEDTKTETIEQIQENDDNKNIGGENEPLVENLSTEQNVSSENNPDYTPAGIKSEGIEATNNVSQTTVTEGLPKASSEESLSSVSEGSPTVSSEVAPDVSSEGTPIDPFDRSPTASSEGSPTASSEGSPIDPLDRSPTASSEGTSTAPFEGSSIAPFEGSSTAPSEGPSTVSSEGSSTAPFEGSTTSSEKPSNLFPERSPKTSSDDSQTTLSEEFLKGPSDDSGIVSHEKTIQEEVPSEGMTISPQQDIPITSSEGLPIVSPSSEIPPISTSKEQSPEELSLPTLPYPSYTPDIPSQSNNSPSLDIPSNTKDDNYIPPKYDNIEHMSKLDMPSNIKVEDHIPPKYDNIEQLSNIEGNKVNYPEESVYRPSFYPRTEALRSKEQEKDQHTNNENKNVVNDYQNTEQTPTDATKETLSDTENLEIYGNTEEVKTDDEEKVEEEKGFFSGLFDMFFGSNTADKGKTTEEDGYVERNDDVLLSHNKVPDVTNACTADPSSQFCSSAEKPTMPEEDSFINSLDIHSLLYLLGVSGATVVIFLWGYIIIDKMRKEGPLIAKINNLEKALLVTKKENQILAEKLNDNTSSFKETAISNEIIEELKLELEESNNARSALEEQVQSLEKELENSTEVGLELNRMLSDVLSSQNGSETLMSNIEQLQNKLVEQQAIINTLNSNVSERETANHELQLELEINTKKVVDLQTELDKMVQNLLKIEEEKDLSQNKYEVQIHELKSAVSNLKKTNESEISSLKHQATEADKRFKETQRNLELKINEYNLLKDNVKSLSGGNDVKSMLDANSMKAELQQLQREKGLLSEHLQQHQQLISGLEGEVEVLRKDVEVYRGRYEEADKEKLQVLTKLDVLNAYFKEREAELQKEITKYETMWMEKQGEATSTVGRIKFMQEEIQNFKSQNESLKQEIISQEVELKSQISVLEKKAHENWVSARQAERKLEDVKQEAATLRNRLTLRERNMNEDKSQNRLKSPLESNGDHPLSPIHMTMETPASPPLLYGAPRDRMTTSPPLPGLPPLFPPPPGVPFMPPPMPGMPPFMPPPPNMFPGDHRPPPLGRMSSPPLNSRYSPDSRYYDRNTPSPTDDEYYASSHRGYSPSPYNGSRDNRRDYGRNRSNTNKGGVSSGSANSNDSLDKINRHNSKV